MAYKLSLKPEDAAGPSSSSSSLDDEARQLCQAFRDEKYEMDEVAEAVCDGGLSAGYTAFLQKFRDCPLPKGGRTWADAPHSKEYQERKERFDKAFVEHLRTVHDSPFKYARTNAFLDLRGKEGSKHGFKEGY